MNIKKKISIIFTAIKLLTGKARFIFQILKLKIFSMGKVKSYGLGWLASNVDIDVQNNAYIEIGSIEVAAGSKLSVEPFAKLIIGDGVFFNRSCSIISKRFISIGSNTLFGENVKIYDHDHIHVPFLEKNMFNSNSIIIGKGCWFGCNVVILKGVKIGDNVTVGANLTIYKDIPSNVVLTSTMPLKLRLK